MAMICDYCGRGIMRGNKVSHAKNRSHRLFKPNLHTRRVKVGTRTVTAKLCTTCIKTLRKAENIKREQAVESATA